MLSVGIVGLPNVGKSTLFRTLTKKQVDCENFPFCTIEPNVGVVEVPDTRLQELAKKAGSEKVIPAAIEFVDIAGLVQGAHKGEGLGNKFLANIRETDAICHVVRGFENPNVIHVDGNVEPSRDVEVIELELAMADLATVEKRIERLQTQKKGAKAGAFDGLEAMLVRLKAALEAGQLANQLTYTDDEQLWLKELSLLTAKPIVYVVNVSEEDAADPHWQSPLGGDRIALPLCIKLESEIVELPEAEQSEFLEAMGLDATGLDKLIRRCFDELDLITYFTAGPKEARAWQVTKGAKAPQAAGVIHTDFEKSFIRAEVITTEDYLSLGPVGAREAGKQRVEGKEYVMKDGDVCYFRVGA